MRHRIVLLLLWLMVVSGTFVSAQTIIDLNSGGSVRSKTQEDYVRETIGLQERLKADSLAYVDRLTRAFNALYRDSLHEAERLLNDALRLRPQAPANFIVRHYLGKIDMARGQFKPAVEKFTQLLKERPLDREIRLDRATCYFELGSIRPALQDCDVLLKGEQRDELRIRALFLRSAVYRKNRQSDLARNDLNEILQLDATNTSALLLIPLCLEEMGQPQEALNQLNLFVTSHPERVDGWVARAELEIRLGMTAAARADYDQALRLSPDDANLYVSRATLLLDMNVKAAAKKDLEKAVQLGIERHLLAALFNRL